MAYQFVVIYWVGYLGIYKVQYVLYCEMEEERESLLSGYLVIMSTIITINIIASTEWIGYSNSNSTCILSKRVNLRCILVPSTKRTTKWVERVSDGEGSSGN